MHLGNDLIVHIHYLHHSDLELNRQGGQQRNICDFVHEALFGASIEVVANFDGLRLFHGDMLPLSVHVTQRVVGLDVIANGHTSDIDR